MLKIEKVLIEEKKINKSKVLDNVLNLMKKNNIDGNNMLPKNSWHEVSFELHNSYTGFANGLYRVLVEELLTLCISAEEKNIITDDKFIGDALDGLIKNLNLLPVKQELLDSDKTDKLEIFLNKYNDTNDIQDITIDDFKIKDKTGKNVNIEEVFPETNIIVVRLRPGRFIKINNIFFEKGYSKNNAAKFSLLNNIIYYPTDIIPFNIYEKDEKKRGTRSADHNSSSFFIKFITCGNIKPKTVISRMIESISENLNIIKTRIEKYNKSEDIKKYYSDEGIEVYNKNDVIHYVFTGQYLTIMNMISQRCYVLDNTIPFVTGGVERFDTNIGIIKIMHADPNNILLQAIDECFKDLEIIKKAF
jgi:hypothetical protein